MTKYPYLKDSAFLFNLFKNRNAECFVKITVLNFNEKPLKEIQGRVTGGNFNLDGKSSVRRTGNLSVYIEEKDASYMEVNGYFSLNKKIKVETGIVNNTNDYENYPIIWFPQGVFVIMNLSISKGVDGTSASLQLKDKMVFLNGECGGVIPATTTFSEYDELDPETGDYVIKQPTIVQIIKEVVCHLGGEQPGKIIVSDIDTRIKKVMKWTKNLPIYSQQTGVNRFLYTLSKPEGEEGKDFKAYYYGQDIGFINVDFYYPGELVAKEGETICGVLDKIKNLLGNFEYYYDLDGNFIFQEIKNYLNNTPKVQNFKESEQEIQNGYIIQPRKGKALYDFDMYKDLILSYSNSPQYSQVKNDFIVWGERESVTGNKLPIRFHLAIDKKPIPGQHLYDFFLIKDEKILTGEEVYHAKLPINYSSGSNFPSIGDVDRLYCAEDSKKIYRWNPQSKVKYTSNCPVPYQTEKIIEDKEEKVYQVTYYNEVKSVIEYDKGSDFPKKENNPSLEIIYQDLSNTLNEGGYYIYNPKEERIISKPELPYHKTTNNENGEVQFYTHYFPYKDKVFKRHLIKTTDWRSELYFSGANTSRFGNDSNYYYTELVNEWPKLYELIPTNEKKDGRVIYTDQLKESVQKDPTSIDYFLDFIDSEAAISEFSINNIGRRPKVVSDSKINCVFEFPIEDIILIPAGRDNTEDLVNEASKNQQNYTAVDETIYNGLSGGGSQNSAYNKIRDLLYQHTNYNETVTVQMLPLYFLEPNVRIYLQDSQTGIYGDYMINSISMPMDVNGQMSLSCSKALERI